VGTTLVRELSKKIISQDRKIHLNITLPDSNPGDYPSIVFLPPAGCHSHIPVSFINKFVACGYNLIGLDYPGHGKSEGPAGHFTIEEIVEAVMNSAAWAKEQFKSDMGILATSMGGFIGCYTLLAQEKLIKSGKLGERYFTSAILHSLAFSPDDVWAYCRFPLFYKSLRKIYMPVVSNIPEDFFRRFPVFDLRKYKQLEKGQKALYLGNRLDQGPFNSLFLYSGFYGFAYRY
jgi:alpha-beta hydrolase superfamily lysophospholipase